MNQRRHAIGFTLVEMLVVIAIVAILASLLLPALARANSRTQRFVCMNNMRQIAIGFHTYMADNESVFPGSGFLGQPEDWLYAATHKKQPWYAETTSMVRGHGPVRRFGTVHEILGGGSTNTFRCPGDKEAPDRTEEPGRERAYTSVYDGFPFSYSLTTLWPIDIINGKIAGQVKDRGLASWPDRKFPLHLVVNPSAKIMNVEEETKPDDLRSNEGMGSGTWVPFHNPVAGVPGSEHDSVSTRHDQRSSFAFVDGHVETHKPAFAKRPEHWSPRY